MLRAISDRVSQTPRSLTYLSQNVVFCFRLEEVDLRHNQLESVCSELFQIESLKYLDLSHNCLKMLFRSIHQIGQLQFSSKDIRNRQCKKATILDLLIT